MPERLSPDEARRREPATATRARRRAELRGTRGRCFAEKQRLTRQWVSLADIADWCARAPGIIEPDEKLRLTAYGQLMKALNSGEFDIAGRTNVLFSDWGCRSQVVPGP